MSKTHYHIPPEEGWKPQSYYVVEVSTSKGNPIFEAILYTGFLDPKNKLQGLYAGIFNPLMTDKFISPNNFKYIKTIRKINIAIPNKGKQITELNLFELKTHEKVCT